MFQLEQEWSRQFLDGTPECLREHTHKYRGTMRSPQQERSPCTRNQLDMRADSLPSTQEESDFPQVPQEENSLSYRYVSGTQSLLPHGERTTRCTDSKAGQITLQEFECRLALPLTEIWMSESPLDNLEKALGHCLIMSGGLTSLWHLESYSEFNASK